mgnify:CR=1 FL=1
MIVNSSAGLAILFSEDDAARLNFGDCFAYALSKATGQPLLYKGEDFSKTDVAGALD